MRRIRVGFPEWHLMRPPMPFRLFAINFFGPCPSLGRAKNNDWPALISEGRDILLARTTSLLNVPYLADGALQCIGHQRMHELWIVALDKIRPITVAGQ